MLVSSLPDLRPEEAIAQFQDTVNILSAIVPILPLPSPLPSCKHKQQG